MSLQVMRQQAVRVVGNGESPATIAKVLGVNVRSVFRWLSDYASGGQKALEAKPIPGRPPKVTPDEMRWLATTIRDETPLQFKFEYALWTLALVGEVLYRKFDKRLSKGSVSRLMRILGYTVQRPLYRAWQQDAELVEKWQAEEFPAIRAAATAAGAAIYFADEAGMRSDHHAGTTWAPQGKTPVIRATGRRFSLNMISAVSARGELRFMVHEGNVDSKVFREFLKRLMTGATHPIYLVVDGHPIHKSKLVKDYVDAQQGKLKLFYLPPYSPQLNPDEQVWGNVKTRVAKQTPQNKVELKEKISGALRRLQKMPAIVIGFFQHPHCRYATI
jgi:transposase